MFGAALRCLPADAQRREQAWFSSPFLDMFSDRDAAVKIVAREMKIEEGLAKEIMALNVYSMELTPGVYKGVGEFVDFLFGLQRIPQKIEPEGVFYTKLLKEVDPQLVKWEAKTEIK